MSGAPLVVVVDDDASLRRALARLLRSAGLRVEALAHAEDLLSLDLTDDGPACAVLDLHLPGLSGLELQQELARRRPELPVIFLTGHGDIPTTVQAMKAGAVDFLAKPIQSDELLAAIRQGLARQAAARVECQRRAELRRRAQTLSDREREVMALVVAGMLNKQAGHRLGVTEKTVKVHRAQVMHKMCAASLPDLVRMAEQLTPAPSL
jgi:FixJ family two-component response regulator